MSDCCLFFGFLFLTQVEEDIDTPLQGRANDYFSYLWSRKNLTAGKGLLSSMPVGMQAEVRFAADCILVPWLRVITNEGFVMQKN